MRERKPRSGASFAFACVLASGLAVFWAASLALERSAAAPQATPAGAGDWGSDHVGKPVPEYITGDECLFCHRDDFGNGWSRNRHQRTVRAADASSPELTALRSEAGTKSFADQVEFLLGDGRQVRYLKRGQEYGKLSLLSAKFTPPPSGRRSRSATGKLSDAKDAHWDDAMFAGRCAGCHTTGVDPKTHAFAATALDCYACHGLVDLKHSKDVKLVYFGKGRQDPPVVIVAICAGCHIRMGKSKSSGLPYPSNFVPGDNLFRDFAVSFMDADLKTMNAGDRHIAENVREVLQNKTQLTCTSCHDVHRQATTRHRQVAKDQTCATCHPNGDLKAKVPRIEVHSALCGY